MIRLIKRYGSRKLYDTEESRYVSLDELADWIRQGQEIRVVDNKTQAEVTSQTLTQIISEEGRKGRAMLPQEVLHELIRLGEQAVSSGVEQLQTSVDRLVQASIDKIGPVRRAREEMSRLRERLEILESSLAEIDEERKQAGPAAKPAASKPAARKPATRKPAAAKPAAKAAKTTKTTASAGTKKAAPARKAPGKRRTTTGKTAKSDS